LDTLEAWRRVHDAVPTWGQKRDLFERALADVNPPSDGAARRLNDDLKAALATWEGSDEAAPTWPQLRSLLAQATRERAELQAASPSQLALRRPDPGLRRPSPFRAALARIARELRRTAWPTRGPSAQRLGQQAQPAARDLSMIERLRERKRRERELETRRKREPEEFERDRAARAARRRRVLNAAKALGAAGLVGLVGASALSAARLYGRRDEASEADAARRLVADLDAALAVWGGSHEAAPTWSQLRPLLAQAAQKRAERRAAAV
jgi:hypothetical protein